MRVHRLHIVLYLLLAAVCINAQDLKELQAQQKKYAEELENTGKMKRQQRTN